MIMYEMAEGGLDVWRSEEVIGSVREVSGRADTWCQEVMTTGRGQNLGPRWSHASCKVVEWALRWCWVVTEKV